MTTPSPVAVEISPETALEFTLTRGTSTGSGNDSSTPKCNMILKHPGGTDQHLAFKVKTTQPRRYLVRPNQGLIAPSGVEQVSILLVEKDKQLFLQSYDRLGQAALDQSKDKFLVQSTLVPLEFSSKFTSEKGKDLSDALTAMWNTASSGTGNIINKKLHVRHKVLDSSGNTSNPSAPLAPSSIQGNSLLQKTSGGPSTSNMTPEQMFQEVATLRRKYDELVAFSVNLTAERDVLNNTLEQTKRDLSNESAQRARLENSRGLAPGNSSLRASEGDAKSGISFLKLIGAIMIACLSGYIYGAKTAASIDEMEGLLGNLLRMIINSF